MFALGKSMEFCYYLTNSTTDGAISCHRFLCTTRQKLSFSTDSVKFLPKWHLFLPFEV